MDLKNYQQKVLRIFEDFLVKADAERSKIQRMDPDLRQDYGQTWVKKAFNDAAPGEEFLDECKNGLNEAYPRVVLKVPTGGGKTMLALEAIRRYQNIFCQRQTGLVVWVVPSEVIYTQTIDRFRDRAHYYRQILNQISADRTLIKEKGARIMPTDIEENLVILFLMMQSINKSKTKEGLRVLRDSAGYADFFPLDHYYADHRELLKHFPNLDSTSETFNKIVLTSLANVIRIKKPLIIIDEIHKCFSEQAKGVIDDLNPSMALGLSATPKKEMNILARIGGRELLDEQMIKLDMHLRRAGRGQKSSWCEMLREIKAHRCKLEDCARKYQRNSERYIRPIALIQAEATGKEQRGKPDKVHSEDVRDYLVNELDVPAVEVAIKVSDKNEIERQDLLARDCEVRYIITKYALQEGWDCSFAYILGIIPKTRGGTSLTQLAGRVLRQPNAMKTGIAELDESYAYYCQGDSGDFLNGVIKGLKHEGLEDLVHHVADPAKPRSTRSVAIKGKFRKYDASFYLPIWLMCGNAEKRRFNYERDIRAHIEYAGLSLPDEKKKEIGRELGQLIERGDEQEITIDEGGRLVGMASGRQTQITRQIDMPLDMTTRLYEIMGNAFLAKIKSDEFLVALRESIEEEQLQRHFGFIVAKCSRWLTEQKQEMEESIFRDHVKQGRLGLTVSYDEGLGWRAPKKDKVGGETRTYQKYLYEELEREELNKLERGVADILENQERLLWWFRNRAKRNWYAIQGWRQQKVYPDFVAARRADNGKVEIVYVIESKGEHLVGNEDTTYKNDLLESMNNQQVKIVRQDNLIRDIQDKFGFYLIEGDGHEGKINKFFNTHQNDE